jgi:hypothetical protein
MIYEIQSRRSGEVIATKEADTLKGALELLVRDGADLSDAVLSDADVRGADLRGSQYIRVPQLHQKILAAIDGGGSIEMGDWHTCETTHCRAGWAIHLAGNIGRYLESQYGPAMAGALITQASCPWLEKVPDFYANNEDALADIKACAEREIAEETKNVG